MHFLQFAPKVTSRKMFLAVLYPWQNLLSCPVTVERQVKCYRYKHWDPVRNYSYIHTAVKNNSEKCYWMNLVKYSTNSLAYSMWALKISVHVLGCGSAVEYTRRYSGHKSSWITRHWNGQRAKSCQVSSSEPQTQSQWLAQMHSRLVHTPCPHSLPYISGIISVKREQIPLLCGVWWHPQRDIDRIKDTLNQGSVL